MNLAFKQPNKCETTFFTVKIYNYYISNWSITVLLAAEYVVDIYHIH